MSAPRLCTCAHPDHPYYCLHAGCTCAHFAQARCECTDETCGGERHHGLARCGMNATVVAMVATKVEDGVVRPYDVYVDQQRLLCRACQRRAARVENERSHESNRATTQHALGQVGREYGGGR